MKIKFLSIQLLGGYLFGVGWWKILESTPRLQPVNSGIQDSWQKIQDFQEVSQTLSSEVNSINCTFLAEYGT